jgi:signal transduction histidine kinase
LINLVRNAIFVLSGQSNGLIVLSAKWNGKNELVLEVSDNGPGIPPEIQPQVFVPFFTTKQKGTGIGLSIVRKILNMHGGSIRFQTGEGEGTTFIARLPQKERE